MRKRNYYDNVKLRQYVRRTAEKVVAVTEFYAAVRRTYSTTSG